MLPTMAARGLPQTNASVVTRPPPRVSSSRPSTADLPILPPVDETSGELGDGTLRVFADLFNPEIPWDAQNIVRQEAPSVTHIAQDPRETPPISTHHPSHVDAVSFDSSSTTAISLGVLDTNSHDEARTGLNDATILRAATLEALVDRLISKSRGFSQDLAFRETFLIAYPAFSSAGQVFQLLKERYESVASSNHTGKERALVRYPVLEFLELWLQADHVHIDDIDVLNRMKVFISSTPAASQVYKSADRLGELIDNRLNALLSSAPTPGPDPLILNPTIPNISPRELAIVFTLMEGDRFRKITSSDCIAWLEDMPDTKISHFIAENNKLSFWAQKSILKSGSYAQRLSNVTYFLSTIEECRILRNFSSACALSNAFTSSITSLKRTFDLDKQGSRLFEKSRALISCDMNFKAYRTALDASREPCLPWIYVHLHDLKMIHRYNSGLVEQGEPTRLINFYRYHRVHNLIRHILSYQNPSLQPVNHVVSTEIRDFVRNRLRSIVVNDTLRKWVQTRGSALAHEERSDYLQYLAELQQSGFIPKTTSSPHFSSLRAHGQMTSPITPNNPGHTNNLHPALEHVPEVAPGMTVGGPHAPNPLSRSSEHCLDGRIHVPNRRAVAFGAYAEVWEGFLGRQKIAIKIVRRFSPSGRLVEESTLRRRLCREYGAWSSVSQHPNILDCLGFTYDFSSEPYDIPSLISPWMSNGTVFPYLERHRDANRLELLAGVAQGLLHLHNQQPSIIHGDLRAGNILISDAGVPYLSDFGLSRFLQAEEMTATTEPAGSLRWMAPELLRGEHGLSSSDVWAFGMTVFEIMLEKIPYFEMNPAAAATQIMRGQIPARPLDNTILTDEVWTICQQCWIIVPRRRPSMGEVADDLDDILRVQSQNGQQFYRHTIPFG